VTARKIKRRLDMITHAVVRTDHWGDLKIEIYSDNINLTKGKRLWQQCRQNVTSRSHSWVGQSEDGVLIDAFSHDGSENCNGGFGGNIFELTMVDGSHRVLCGPWSGRPSVHMYNGAPEYMELTVKYGPFGAGIRGVIEDQGFSREFVEAVIKKFKLGVHLVHSVVSIDTLGENVIEVDLQVVDNSVN